MLHRIAPLLFATLLSTFAFANESEIQRNVEKAFPQLKVKGITKAGYLNLYEIQTSDGQILYTDDKVTVVIDGQLIDTKTRTSVTEERLRKLNAIKFSDLPIDQAIKQVRGSGKRVIATFEDPNCGYCKKLAKELLGMKDVTIYTFLTPVLGPDSQKKAEAIWCSADRAKTWSDWMTTNVVPAAATASCDTAGLQRSAALGEKYRVRGTPTIFLSTGERIPGYVPVAQLEQRIANIK